MESIGEEGGSKRGRDTEAESHMSSWNDVPHSPPLAYPKIPGAGNVKAKARDGRHSPERLRWYH